MGQQTLQKIRSRPQVVVVPSRIVVEFEMVAAHLFPDEDRLVGDIQYYAVAIPKKDVSHVVIPGALCWLLRSSVGIIEGQTS